MAQIFPIAPLPQVPLEQFVNTNPVVPFDPGPILAMDRAIQQKDAAALQEAQLRYRVKENQMAKRRQVQQDTLKIAQTYGGDTAYFTKDQENLNGIMKPLMDLAQTFDSNTNINDYQEALHKQSLAIALNPQVKEIQQRTARVKADLDAYVKIAPELGPYKDVLYANEMAALDPANASPETYKSVAGNFRKWVDPGEYGKEFSDYVEDAIKFEEVDPATGEKTVIKKELTPEKLKEIADNKLGDYLRSESGISFAKIAALQGYDDEQINLLAKNELMRMGSNHLGTDSFQIIDTSLPANRTGKKGGAGGGGGRHTLMSATTFTSPFEFSSKHISNRIALEERTIAYNPQMAPGGSAYHHEGSGKLVGSGSKKDDEVAVKIVKSLPDHEQYLDPKTGKINIEGWKKVRDYKEKVEQNITSGFILTTEEGVRDNNTNFAGITSGDANSMKNFAQNIMSISPDNVQGLYSIDEKEFVSPNKAGAFGKDSSINVVGMLASNNLLSEAMKFEGKVDQEFADQFIGAYVVTIGDGEEAKRYLMARPYSTNATNNKNGVEYKTAKVSQKLILPDIEEDVTDIVGTRNGPKIMAKKIYNEATKSHLYEVTSGNFSLIADNSKNVIDAGNMFSAVAGDKNNKTWLDEHNVDVKVVISNERGGAHAILVDRDDNTKQWSFIPAMPLDKLSTEELQTSMKLATQLKDLGPPDKSDAPTAEAITEGVGKGAAPDVPQGQGVKFYTDEASKTTLKSSGLGVKSGANLSNLDSRVLDTAVDLFSGIKGLGSNFVTSGFRGTKSRNHNGNALDFSLRYNPMEVVKSLNTKMSDLKKKGITAFVEAESPTKLKEFLKNSGTTNYEEVYKYVMDNKLFYANKKASAPHIHMHLGREHRGHNH